ncbi:MAG: hypothetical protein GXY76_12615 [Chloroflexi bacterium]|nr:hypothetical protein [Chloroflexota bacterium]
MDSLRVRVYNVRFGDAVLISVPDRGLDGATTLRHILIDVGNVLSGAGGQDPLFEAVVRDVLEVLDGQPLDLYVMTHEHMDHVQGLPYAAHKLGLEIPVAYSWLTASAAPDYYDNHPEARKQRLAFLEAYDAIASFLAAVPERETPWMRALMLNNNPRSTADCVDYLRGLAAATSYVYRGCDSAGTHPFQEAVLEILAPEEDTSAYYGRLQPMTLGFHLSGAKRPQPRPTVVEPPPGVDAGAFYNLVERRRQGLADNLLAIDRAANETSVVFTLAWRGWKLLFAGDAELRSWKTMDRHDLLSPVNLLKVSHHGSHNGTPDEELLAKLLPLDDETRIAAVSTFPETYGGVPHRETLKRLDQRAEVRSVEGLPDGAYMDILFDDEAEAT